jgi:hypothetical protein
MKKHDDYISGPHHFWIHFWCGLLFGGLVSAWISWQFFETRALILVSTGIAAPVIAYCCGRWGDSAWHWLIQKLQWWV